MRQTKSKLLNRVSKERKLKTEIEQTKIDCLTSFMLFYLLSLRFVLYVFYLDVNVMLLINGNIRLMCYY